MRRLAFITGASSGIGQGMATAAATDGATVATVSRRAGPGIHHAADLSEPAAWPATVRWFQSVIDAEEPDWVAFAHCAATLTPIGFAADVDADAYGRNVVLNSASPQVLGAGFLKAAARAGLPGSVMQISSGAASKPYPGWSSYCAAKAAVDQWARVANQEERDAGRPMRVMSVAPGVVATDMQTEIRNASPEQFPHVERFHALARDGDLADPSVVGEQLWRILVADEDRADPVFDLRNALPPSR